MSPAGPEVVTFGTLLDRHAGVLLDAYGVLVDGSGALAGTAAVMAELARRGTPFAIVTNDASRTGETYAKRFAGYGITIAPDRFVTAGSLLPGYFQSRGLAGARTCVLGTADSELLVRQGGGVPVPVARGMELDALAVCDDSGTPFLEGIEIALSAIVRAVEAGRRPALVLPNPDLVYPKGGSEYGFTAGSMALLIEAALARRLPGANLRFEHLGKPEPHLFLEGARRLGLPVDQLVMIGDQLETDIAGAASAGIAGALVLAGVSRWDASSTHRIVPTYVVERLP